MKQYAVGLVGVGAVGAEMIKCLKERGIYACIDMCTYRKFKSGDGVKFADLSAAQTAKVPAETTAAATRFLMDTPFIRISRLHLSLQEI